MEPIIRNEDCFQTTVLLVDDEVEITNALRRVLRSLPVEVITATAGKEACEIMTQQPVNMLISDMRMPGMSGTELITWALKHSPDTFRVILSGFSDVEAIITAINEGKVQRFIQKPWNNDALLRVIREGIAQAKLKHHNHQLQRELKYKNKRLAKLNQALEVKVALRTDQVKKAIKKIECERKDTVKILFNSIGIHNELSGQFALKVRHLASSIAREMQLPAQTLSNIQMAAMLSEIGLIGTEKAALQQPFESLNLQQREVHFKQINEAAKLLLPANHLQDVTTIIVQQYENWNGKGYPGQRCEKEICIGARILAVVRDFWRWTDGRMSADTVDYNEALLKINLGRTKQYDPSVVNILVKRFEILVSQRFGQQVSSQELTPDMVLLEGVYSKNHQLVLVKGHKFCESSIQKIRKFENRQKVKFSFHVTTAATADLN